MATPLHRILIVEDEPGTARLQRRVLERAGFEVIHASSAEEALEMLENNSVSLMVMDYHLCRNRNGIELYVELTEKGHDVPVIMVTAISSESTVIRAIRVGVRDFVTKTPDYLDYLLEAVQRVLHQVEKEQQLAESESRLAAIINHANDAILEINLEGQILYWNHGAPRIYGWTFEEVSGKHFGEFLSIDPHLLDQAMQTVLRESEWNGEFQQSSSDDEIVIVDSRWTLMDQAGGPNTILVINSDITDKKKLEAEMLREQRIKSLGLLAAGIAHDLNNVITPILLSVEVLKSVVPEELWSSLLTPIQVGAERGAGMVQQIFSFTRGVDEYSTDLHMKQVINDVVNISQGAFPKTITIRSSIASDLHPISGDYTQMYQVVMDLSVNAREAMEEGGTLTIAAENVKVDERHRQYPQALEGPYVKIAVSDTGDGIPREILDTIFDPFVTTKPIEKGRGLGLSTVRNIVKNHKGFILVESEEGKGTCFEIYIPASDQLKLSESQHEPKRLPHGQGETLLVVDDETSLCEMMKATLETHGYHVLTANDGANAIATFAQHREEIRLILTDMMMPIMDGPTTIRAIRQIDPTLKIIAFTGLAQEGARKDCEELGISAWIQKPFSASKLLATIKDNFRMEDESEDDETTACCPSETVIEFQI